MKAKFGCAELNLPKGKLNHKVAKSAFGKLIIAAKKFSVCKANI